MHFGKVLKYIFIVSFATAIIYPLVNMYVIFPTFSELVVNNTEDEAVRVAQSLSSAVIADGNRLKAPDEFEEQLRQSTEDFKLEKLKVFTDTGLVIYSTDSEDVGLINNKPYFFEKVARGQLWTKLVQKGTRTLEGRVVSLDVVETYVPIMDGSDFLGAFEIYYDVTLRNQKLNDVAFRSSMISFVLVFSFFVITIVILFREERSRIEPDTVKMPVIYKSPFYLLLVMSGAIFMSEIVVMFFLTALSPQSKFVEAIIDSAMLVMMVSPFLYFFLLNPLTMHIKRRKQAEEELKKSHDELEVRVKERTYELIEKNRQLGDEISERKKVEMENEKLIAELSIALDKVKSLKGLLPICSSCNKIRDDDGKWTNVDVYIGDHSEAEFTHGYCPECERKHFPQLHKD